MMITQARNIEFNEIRRVTQEIMGSVVGFGKALDRARRAESAYFQHSNSKDTDRMLSMVFDITTKN